MKKDLVVIDCQYDFIDGTLACKNAHEAVDEIVKIINTKEYNVFYSQDWHKSTNKSFAVNGGTWPVHCVQDTQGSALDPKFYSDVIGALKPTPANRYKKGVADEPEEYSAFNAVNLGGDALHNVLGNDVTVVGIASEYCVMETVKELVKSGRNVKVVLGALGWVDDETHAQAIEEYQRMGVL